ncbi:ABC transporter permease [Candidatus Aerophobetes bacterium Ae_b3b]|nr:MAG: ABC transporter permease [Candidatus Aerophobetes bacterium Ae_b3b]
MTRRINLKKLVPSTIFFILLAILSLPFVYIMMTSFKTHLDIMLRPILFTPTLKNYVDLFFTQTSNFPRYMLNSLIVALLSTVFIIGIAGLSAYGISRSEFVWHLDKILLGWVLFLRMVFPVAFALPFYKIAQSLNLLDTKIILIVFYTTINIPFAVWMLKGFFDQLPRAYEEAAFIDGCSIFGVFWRVAMPIISSGAVATAILVFMLGWNEFLFALIITESSRSMTLTVGIAGLCQQYMVEWGKMAAAATIFTIPIFVLSVFVQDYLGKGLTMGIGIKE